MSLFVINYAFRNLFRHKRRSFLTVGTVSLSTLVTIVGFQYADAVLNVWKQGAIDHGAGHAQIHKNEYYLQPDVMSPATLMNDKNPLLDLISQDKEVLATAKRLIFEGIISFGKKTMYFQGRGIDIERETQVSPGLLGQELTSGQFIENPQAYEVTIGKGLAEALEVKVGDEVTLMTNTLSGAVNGIDVLVTGIIDFPVPAVSKRLLYMGIQAAQKALAAENTYTEVAVRLKTGVDAVRWLDELKLKDQVKEFQTLFDIRGWWEVEPMIRKVEEIWHSVMGIIIFLLFSTAGLSVLNIIYLLVAERIIEIGTLLSLGARSKVVLRLFSTEAMLIGVVGSLFGAFIANGVLFALSLIGVPFASPFGGGNLIIFPSPNFIFSLSVVVFGVFICFCASIFPSIKASKVPPIVAFRGQLT